MYEWIIYKTTCLENGKIYVGQHKTKNRNDGYIGSGKLIRRAIEKYGVSSFNRVILEVCECKADADSAEEAWIGKLNATDNAIGYNITHFAWGGQPCTGETRLKISAALVGRVLSEETKLKMRKPKSPEVAAKISASNKNRAHLQTGKKWYHNPITGESGQFLLKPEEWVPGRGKIVYTKVREFSEEAKEKLRANARDPARLQKVRTTLTGHLVSSETREKISKSLRSKHNGTKTSNNQTDISS